MLAHVEFPQVISAFKLRQVVEVVAVIGDHSAGDAARVGGESHHTVLDAVELDHDVLDLILLVGFFVLVVLLLVLLVLFGLLLVGLFLGFLLGFLSELVVLLAHAILVVGVLIDKCQQHIVLRAP